ncbi:MAG: metallopeptidase family protein [Mycobacteriales bacterium]
MERQRFEDLVSRALDDIPEELLNQMDNVVVVVEDEPEDGELLGLYEGYALTDRGWEYGNAVTLPDQITVYRNPILRLCQTEADVVREVGVTVVHEIAHHFGIDDDRLHELGWD